MIVEPERLLPAVVQAGADRMTVHAETCPHLHRVLHQIRELGARPGVALNPSTPLSAVENVIGDLDLLLVMTVNPGFGGQSFIHSMLPRSPPLAGCWTPRSPPQSWRWMAELIAETAPLAVSAGATVLVAGTSVFGHRGGVEAGLAALRRSVP